MRNLAFPRQAVRSTSYLLGAQGTRPLRRAPARAAVVVVGSTLVALTLAGGCAHSSVPAAQETTVLQQALAPHESERGAFETELAAIEARLTAHPTQSPARETDLRHRVTLIRALTVLDHNAGQEPSPRAGALADAYAALAHDTAQAQDADDILYGLGFAAEQAGRPADAIRAYQQIVDDHPSSNFRGWALVAIGMIQFTANDHASARPRFEEAAAASTDDGSPLAATYFLGWIAFGQQRFDVALTEFRKVADEGSLSTDTRVAAFAEHARTELPRVYPRTIAAGALDAEAMRTFLERYFEGDDTLAETEGGIAEVVFEAERWADVLTVTHDLIARHPSDTRACRWQLMATMAAWRADLVAETPVESIRLLDTYAALRNAPGGDEDAVIACRAAIAGSVVQLASEWYRLGFALPEGSTLSTPPPSTGTFDHPRLLAARALFAHLGETVPELSAADYARFESVRNRPTLAEVRAAIAAIDVATAPRPAPARRPRAR